jgi:trans-aconitate methyltransferase
MGVMYFSSNQIPEVAAFIKKHYKGGSVIDYGCGTGRYADCFPDKEYLGVDGHAGNISYCIPNFPKKQFLLQDLDEWKPNKKFEYLFSSVTFDQVKKLPKGWAKHYILIEPSKYEKEFKPTVSESLLDTDTRMMYV